MCTDLYFFHVFQDHGDDLKRPSKLSSSSSSSSDTSTANINAHSSLANVIFAVAAAILFSRA